MPRIFAIGDLHLSLSVENKAMDVFGPGWANHVARLKEGWQDTVGEEDLVLVPGDISWGLRLEEALADLDFIHGLKGTKILLRGNHDYWWTGYSKVKSILPPSVKAVQNDALLWNGVIVGGTRGWNTPLSPDFSESKDRKIFEREKLRLGLSLRAMDDMAGRLRVVMLHYPPFNEKGEPTDFADLIRGHGVDHAVYGHLHGWSCLGSFEGDHEGTRYHLVSADHLQFVPRLIAEST
jgi:predicted phosphohydrolase